MCIVLQGDFVVVRFCFETSLARCLTFEGESPAVRSNSGRNFEVAIREHLCRLVTLLNSVTISVTIQVATPLPVSVRQYFRFRHWTGNRVDNTVLPVDNTVLPVDSAVLPVDNTVLPVSSGTGYKVGKAVFPVKFLFPVESTLPWCNFFKYQRYRFCR